MHLKQHTCSMRKPTLYEKLVWYYWNEKEKHISNKPHSQSEDWEGVCAISDVQKPAVNIEVGDVAKWPLEKLTKDNLVLV